jgi:hypothetical protein
MQQYGKLLLVFVAEARHKLVGHMATSVEPPYCCIPQSYA